MNISKQQLALAKFEKLIDKSKSTSSSIFSSNEAATRLLLIDEILQILGWEKSSFNTEKWITNAGYTDYLLTHKDVPRLVLEAKKIGQTFKSSSTNNTKTDYEIRYLKRAFKSPFSDVVEQALRYCKEAKVAFAVITNGAEWIALQLIPPPGVSLDSAKAIYFGNIFSDCFEFDLFWSLLSIESFESFKLEEYLANINYQQAEVSKVLQSDYSSLQWKSGRSEKYLPEFYENFFSKITDSNQRKMLEYCFVADSKLDQYRGDLKRLLKDTKPSYLPSDTSDFEPGESKDSILKNGNSGQVVIITGSVGCGKSTLVTKCLVEARQQKGELAKTILIDLINEVSRQDIDARGIIFSRIYEFLEEEFSSVFELEYLRKTFSRDLKSLKSSSHKAYFELNPNEFISHEAQLLATKKSDIENFVYASLKQLTSENNSVILILDNVDRAHEKFQEEMYALCHNIASRTGAKTIITLREFTFFRNKSGGFLDVRPEDKVIHLKAPNFEKLISKRIKYIENNLSDDFRIKEWRNQTENFDDFMLAVKVHANTLKDSILISSDGHNILETLTSISWHNIRYFYELLKRVHKQLGSTNGIWENREVIAALMASTETGESPVLPNIFIPTPSASQSYFIKIRFIAYLSTLKSGEITNGVPLSRITDFLKMYGYQKIWIHSCVEESVKQKLVECLEIPSEDESIKKFTVKLEGTYRLSPLGLLYLNQIVRNGTYRSLIAVDLPIHYLTKFEEFRKEYNEINSYMSDSQEYLLFKEGLDIILSSNLCSLTEAYLQQELVTERVLSESFLKDPELQLTERKIAEVFVSKGATSLTKSPNPVSKSKPQGAQLKMDFDNEVQIFTEENNFDHTDFVNALNFNFDTCKYQGTEFIPLIFCALRLKLIEGIDFCNGAEITKTINEYLVEDGNGKFPNNVSRALRSPKLKGQSWIQIKASLHSKNKMFGLNEKWQAEWDNIFNS